MNDVLVVQGLEEQSTNSRIIFFNTYAFRDFTGKSLNRVEFKKCCLLTTVVKGATFPSHEFLFGTDKADVWLGSRLYLAWWQEVLRDLLLTFNP